MEFDNLVITYNGEVYNFKEIRKELENLGYTFKSNTDTEVVLRAFHKWGIDAVRVKNGCKTYLHTPFRRCLSYDEVGYLAKIGVDFG